MNIKNEIKELLFKPINVSTDGMDKFEEKEMMKKRTFARNIFDTIDTIGHLIIFLRP